MIKVENLKDIYTYIHTYCLYLRNSKNATSFVRAFTLVAPALPVVVVREVSCVTVLIRLSFVYSCLPMCQNDVSINNVY